MVAASAAAAAAVLPTKVLLADAAPYPDVEDSVAQVAAPGGAALLAEHHQASLLQELTPFTVQLSWRSNHLVHSAHYLVTVPKASCTSRSSRRAELMLWKM